MVRLGLLVAADAHDDTGGGLALQAGPGSPDPAGPSPASTTTAVAGPSPPSTTMAPSTTVAGPPSPNLLMAWTAGGLPSGFADALGGRPEVRHVTVVRGDLLGLVATADDRGRPVDAVEPGWELPFDVLAVDPQGYGELVDRPVRRVLRRLGPDEAVLSETSAEVRRLDVGGRLQLASGRTLTVVGVVPDAGVAGAEAVVNRATGEAVGVRTDRFVLLTHRGPRAPLDDVIRDLVGGPVRTRAPGETPFLRHADAVLPQALIKERFGEFAYRPTGPGSVAVDPAWVSAHIVTADLPVLGRVTCHRDLLPALRGAVAELVDANLAHLVASFEGCYNPRTIGGSRQLSRHAWGAAVDVNFSVNPTGASTTQDPRLEAIFERWGFGSGDLWLVPDSGHFEYIAPPSPELD